MTEDAPLAIEPVAELDALREEWDGLAEQSQNVFASWDWTAIWWRHFGAGRSSLTTACRSADGRLVAVLPLYVWRSRPLRIVRLIGHGAGDELGPICAPADRPAAARALRAALRDERWDVFVGEQLPGEGGWSALLGARVLGRAGSPLLRFPGTSWDELLAARSRNFREQVRRRERKLAQKYELRYRLADDPSRLQEDLDTLFALHGARWSGRESAFGGPREAFHREFAARALERGWLRLWLLELDGGTVAAWYGFRYGGVESFYQAGRDPSWDRASVGFVLLAHSIREALRDGMREYRFLRGGEEYKYRFASDDPGLETIGLSRGIAGAAALAAAVVLPERLRARLAA